MIFIFTHPKTMKKAVVAAPRLSVAQSAIVDVTHDLAWADAGWIQPAETSQGQVLYVDEMFTIDDANDTQPTTITLESAPRAKKARKAPVNNEDYGDGA